MTSAQPAERELSNKLGWWPVFHAEWSKLWSLRAVVVLVSVMPVVAMACGLLAVLPSFAVSALPAASEFVSQSLSGSAVPTALLGAAVGVLAMGSEFDEGTYDRTLLAVPRRRSLLLMKAAASATLVALAAATSLLLTFALTTLLVPSAGSLVEIGKATAPIALSAVAAVTFSVIAVAVAAISRSIVRASLVLAVLFVLAPLAGTTLLEPSISRLVTPLLPTSAAGALVGAPRLDVSVSTFLTGPIGGLVVLVSWVLVLVAVMLLRAYLEPKSPRSSATQRQVERSRAGHQPADLTFRGQLMSAVYRIASLRLARFSALSTLALAVVAAFLYGSSGFQSLTEQGNAYDREAWIELDLGLAMGAVSSLIVLFIPLSAAAIVLGDLVRAPSQAALTVAPRRTSTLLSTLGAVAALAFTTALLSLVVSGLIVAPMLANTLGVTAPPLLTTVALSVRGATSITLATVLVCAVAVLMRNLVPTIITALGILIAVPATANAIQSAVSATPNVWIYNAFMLLPGGARSAAPAPHHLEWEWLWAGGELQVHPDVVFGIDAVWLILAVFAAAIAFQRRPAAN